MFAISMWHAALICACSGCISDTVLLLCQMLQNIRITNDVSSAKKK